MVIVVFLLYCCYVVVLLLHCCLLSLMLFSALLLFFFCNCSCSACCILLFLPLCLLALEGLFYQDNTRKDHLFGSPPSRFCSPSAFLALPFALSVLQCQCSSPAGGYWWDAHIPLSFGNSQGNIQQKCSLAPILGTLSGYPLGLSSKTSTCKATRRHMHIYIYVCIF